MDAETMNWIYIAVALVAGWLLGNLFQKWRWQRFVHYLFTHSSKSAKRELSALVKRYSP